MRLQSFLILSLVAFTIGCNEKPVALTETQTETTDTAILLMVIREVTSQTPIFYTDITNPLDSDSRLEKILRSDKIFDSRRAIVNPITGERIYEDSANSLALNGTEQAYLLSNLKIQTRWPDNLFANSKRVARDSVWEYLYQQNIRQSSLLAEAILNRDSLSIPTTKDYSYVFTFRKPIYLRHRTLCFIAWSAICGGECGKTAASFYKKEKGGWEKWIEVSSGYF